jgi:hypothetical protein
LFRPSNPAIRDFLLAIRSELKDAAGKAFGAALKAANARLKKEGVELLAERGEKALANTLVKGALKKLPIVLAVFFILDARENGYGYAFRNMVVPADLINEAIAAQGASLQQWADDSHDRNVDQLIINAGGDPNGQSAYDRDFNNVVGGLRRTQQR